MSFAARLSAWQRLHGRSGLPWQDTRDPYRIWLSEIMLQQTQVSAVLAYYTRFLERFPDVASLARAPIDDVLALWSGLGYYRRAHHLHAAARAIADEHGGAFPRDATTLATLPGIGRSTAAAIAAFAYGERNPILDGNVKRVLARHRGIEGWPGAPKVEAALWRVAESLVPDDQTEDGIEAYTQGMMDLGATVCLRSRPRCDVCPVHEDCVARIEHRIDELPAPRPAKELPHREVRLLVIEREGALLFEKRPASGIWGGLWSMPECAIEEDVSIVVRSRFGAQVEVRETMPPVEHGFTHYTLTMHPVRCEASSWPASVGEAQVAWLAPDDALQAGLPAPIRKLVLGLQALQVRG
ncbi:MAG: A/G-specific adenine glycosylase [Burkholderiales bacterium]